jgi:hypothetical protein
MTANEKKANTTLEVKKSAGEITVKLGSKKSFGDKVSSFFKGK